MLGIARPKGYVRQLVVCNGNKRNKTIKYQTVNTPEGILLHAYGPVEEHRHDWFIYVSSGLDKALETLLVGNSVQYVIYGDSGLKSRSFTGATFQRSQMKSNQNAFNKSMSRVRIKVEWIFKEVKMYLPVCDANKKM